MKDFLQKTLSFLGLVEEEEDEELVEEGIARVRKINREYYRERRNLQPVPVSMQVHIVEPRTFNDAQSIADKFKAGIPVIINLQDTDKEVSKRVVDFASGIVYALNGAITPIANKVFVITPKNVEIGPEEKRKLQEKIFNQF